ncbi:MAG TPA: FAD-dependent monooxygenase [Bryobacteraceae bacterium]|nr:FAD-dependent monooxygenase [Bryobacteraceae bacterium]
MTEPDVFVVGGGPAGLAAAIAARLKGLSVVVADGNSPPIDKACGEGLMPDARLAAARLGIEIPPALGFEFPGVRFHGAGKSVAARFPRGCGIGVRRTALHAAMIVAAERAGVELRWGAPAGNFDEIRARWILGADGSSSRVRAWAGLDRYRHNTRRFACRQHYAIAPWTDCMEIYWGEGCQIYVTPVGADEVCVALISRDRELSVEAALSRLFPVLDERVRGAPVCSRPRGAVTATARLENVARGNVALIGDASGSVDAITGEGLCLAFKQAALLADAMAGGDLTAYARAHPRLAMRANVMAKLMTTLDRGTRLRQFGMTAMSSVPWIFERLLAVHVG